jgi:hypothetical protein
MLRGRAEAQESGCRVSEGILVVIHHDEQSEKTLDPLLFPSMWSVSWRGW